MSDPAPELKTYKGNCHCGAFKFTVRLPELTTVYRCNCSICVRKGYKWVFPGPDCFVVTKGEGSLKEYKFGPKTMTYKFCGTCGTSVLGKKEASRLGVNASTLEGVSVLDLQVGKFDGKAIDPQFVPYKFTGEEPSGEVKNAKTYYGSCHCGAVTVAMKTPGPLTDGEQTILECDCSICTRDGTTLTYPPTTCFSVSNPSALASYSYGRQFNEHKFCSNCGVSVYIHKKNPVPAEQWKKYKGDKSQDEWRSSVPVNLCCFEDVDWDALKEKNIIERGTWSKTEPMYVCPE